LQSKSYKIRNVKTTYNFGTEKIVYYSIAVVRCDVPTIHCSTMCVELDYSKKRKEKENAKHEIPSSRQDHGMQCPTTVDS
jgi:hypothetical protein